MIKALDAIPQHSRRIVATLNPTLAGLGIERVLYFEEATSMLPRPLIINTGSSGLSCGLIAALAAVAMVIGIARFDLTRPVDHQTSLKLHSQGDHAS